MIHWINVVNDGLMMEMDIYSDVTLTHPPSVFVLLNTLHNNMDFVLRSCHERCRLDNLYSFTCKSETCSLHFIRPGGMVGRQRREQLQMLASALIRGSCCWIIRQSVNPGERKISSDAERETGTSWVSRQGDAYPLNFTTMTLLNAGEQLFCCFSYFPSLLLHSSLWDQLLQMFSAVSWLVIKACECSACFIFKKFPNLQVRWGCLRLVGNTLLRKKSLLCSSSSEYFCRHVWVLILLSTRKKPLHVWRIDVGGAENVLLRTIAPL